jgi:glycosyltransferase involved in cell wall biosynthesis
MIEKLLFVSIIIPCWNEEKFIGKCLDSLVEQDYPKDNLEFLIYSSF